jgi:Melibiase/Glycosyl hydrolase family 36 C-terminal domain
MATVNSIALNRAERRRLSEGRRQFSSKAQFAGFLAAILWSSSYGFAFAADRTVGTLATADTSVQVEAQDTGLKLLSLKSVRRDWNWATGNELPMIKAVEVNGETKATHWKFQMHSSPRRKHGEVAQEIIVFENENPALELKSTWTAYSRPGPIEHQITIRNKSDIAVTVPLQPSIVIDTRGPTGQSLENIWVEKGAGKPSAIGTHRTRVDKDFSASLISTPYCDEPRDAIPWTAIQDVTGQQGWYAGVEFSGRVQMALRAIMNGANADGVRAELGLDSREPFQTRLLPGETFETPTVFVGCYQGDVDDGANQLHRWIETHLRPAVHDERYPLLVNNSWGSGMAVDEKLAIKMIEDSAELGLELFHIDAGWFRAVGDWRADEKKFPRGLASVADAAHKKGLKFGLWVGWTQGGHATGSDPSVLSVFNPAMKNWFTRDYKPEWRTAEFTGADVCLGEVKARDWCLNTLRRIVKENKLDLLEHDQRMIVDKCSRTNHLHTSSTADVAYHAARGYYQVYDTLRAENPELLFENCVNGGHTVDYGIVARTHYISITDVYDPLSNRQAFYDASYALPPSMCECYVENHPGTNIANFRYMLRSGMMGWCTIMLDMSKWNSEQRAAAKRQFETYKTELRPLIAHGNLYHVSERPDGNRWDGIQYASPDSDKAVLFAFRGTTEQKSHTFRLKGIAANREYEISFEDGTGKPVTVRGELLMRDGVTIALPDANSSELIFLKSK